MERDNQNFTYLSPAYIAPVRANGEVSLASSAISRYFSSGYTYTVTMGPNISCKIEMYRILYNLTLKVPIKTKVI